MVHNHSWKASKPSANLEITSIVGNTKVHYTIYKNLPPVLIPRQINPNYAPLPFILLEDLFQYCIPSMPRTSKWVLSLGFPHQNTAHSFPLPHTCHMLWPSHYSWSDHPNNIWWDHKALRSVDYTLFGETTVYLVRLLFIWWDHNIWWDNKALRSVDYSTPMLLIPSRVQNFSSLNNKIKKKRIKYN
jgi:hypothetical protein